MTRSRSDASMQVEEPLPKHRSMGTRTRTLLNLSAALTPPAHDGSRDSHAASHHAAVIQVAAWPSLPPVPPLPAVGLAPEMAALAHAHQPLLQAWWAATFHALVAGELTPQEVFSQDYAAMQRLMSLAILETMQRRWMSGCGPSGRLLLTQWPWMPAASMAALQDIHQYVITRPTAQRELLITHFITRARALIVAGTAEGMRDGDLAASREHRALTDMATRLFRATTATAFAARDTQTPLMGVFWTMLQAHLRTLDCTAWTVACAATASPQT